ncbi:thiamine pyrophosphate-dependent enzyme [Amycolatopsis jejuensis]|uniref:thiamine pyrophosphate-dependent enzyme n=1 Tax=Amycolatopsis jejuensis TaxID=330084 RepID=UPI0005259A77|nr:thiamine pyrophosphate-dependent enzyme [Amycolatopsis jejuensis]
MATVRDAVFDVVRRLGMTHFFGNPGSTEISFLAGLPDDLTFRLALHEGAVVGMATGWAIAQRRPALVSLHTTAGLGNAVGALATARANRVPLVVVVGQQDRRHLAHDPFLAGSLEGLAGDYPVWTHQPARPQEVPGAVARAHHEAVTAGGPALVVVPMDDWDAPAEVTRHAAPLSVVRPAAVDPAVLDRLASLAGSAQHPVLVTGAGADDAWEAVTELAEKLGGPVWQEPFGARAGFPQDHPAFAGHLPPGRVALRAVLAGHDLVLAVGAPVFRQYPREAGDLVPDGAFVVQVTQYPDEAHRSVADLSVIADPGAVCSGVAARLPSPSAQWAAPARVAPAELPSADEPMRPAHVFDLLARLLPSDAVLVEETPSSRPELHCRIPAKAPLGFLSAAAGGLGFGLPAAVGVKLGAPQRPVIAVLGDGSSVYGIQGLWSAAHYQAGVLFVVLSNGGYAIMDRLVESSGRGKAPWPGFGELRLSTIAAGFGCPSRRITSYGELVRVCEEVLPELAARESPLLLDIDVAADPHYGFSEGETR